MDSSVQNTSLSSRSEYVNNVCRPDNTFVAGYPYSKHMRGNKQSTVVFVSPLSRPTQIIYCGISFVHMF